MFTYQGDSVDIPGEGVYPRCGHCGMQVAPTVVESHGHETSALCRLGTERKVQWEAAARLAEAVEETFTAYGEELERVEVFKYLGQLLSWDNNNQPRYLNTSTLSNSSPYAVKVSSTASADLAAASRCTFLSVPSLHVADIWCPWDPTTVGATCISQWRHRGYTSSPGMSTLSP